MAKRPHGPGPASPPPRAPRVRGSRQAATCLRLVKLPGRAHCPSTPLGPVWERTDATRGGVRGTGSGQTPRQRNQVPKDRRKTRTLARVLTSPHKPREPWGTRSANHQMEAVLGAPNWLNTGKLASRWHLFRPQLHLLSLNPRPI